jgi:hypothetical protein
LVEVDGATLEKITVKKLYGRIAAGAMTVGNQYR